MGQIYQSKYPSDSGLEPGTYRIVNARERTAIQISEHDPTKVIAWEQHNGDNQQWFLQRSGGGYQLQNRRYHGYLAVCNTDNHALVVQLADINRVLDLHNGWGHNGNEIHIWNDDGGAMPHRTWRLERLGDDSGNKELAGIQAEIADKNKKLSQLQHELSTAKQELSDLHSLLYQRDETIRQLQQDLKSKEEAHNHAYEASENSAHLRNQHLLSKSKISQQTEITNLQAKMDRIEYLMSQMMNKPGGNTGTSATT